MTEKEMMEEEQRIAVKLEKLEGELNNVLFEAYALGEQDGYDRAMEDRHPDLEWLKEQLRQARVAGFEEGQKVAIASFEGSNRKLYEG